MEKDNCKLVFEERLLSIGIPTQVEDCKNPHSRDEEHLEACDWYDAEVLEGIQESAEATLPKPKGGAKNSGAKITHGFRENVQPSKDKAHFCVEVGGQTNQYTATHNNETDKKPISQERQAMSKNRRHNKEVKASRSLFKR